MPTPPERPPGRGGIAHFVAIILDAANDPGPPMRAADRKVKRVPVPEAPAQLDRTTPAPTPRPEPKVEPTPIRRGPATHPGWTRRPDDAPART